MSAALKDEDIKLQEMARAGEILLRAARGVSFREEP